MAGLSPTPGALSAYPDSSISAEEPAVRTAGRWFGDPERPCLGWLSQPPRGTSESGVVVLPPVGYAYWSSHRTLRVLAEALARLGHVVLRVDYDGTGDSAGDQWDYDRVAAWRQTGRFAAQELRSLGAKRLVLVGVRLGGTFALLDGQSLDADGVVCWAPVTSGRRYAKELRLLSTPVPESEDPLEPPGTVVSAGNVFAAQTLHDLERLALTDIAAPPARRVLIVDDPSGSAAKASAHLEALGGEVRHTQLAGAESALETPPEFATVPEAIIAEICAWLGSCECSAAQTPPQRAAARFRWKGVEIDEEVLSIGEPGHVGVLSAPREPDPSRATLVFLNPGSETHIGPGRAWVEYARELALLGHRSVRVDFRGWGESPDDGRAPGRPYDACGEQDTVEIVEGLRAAGHERVALLGLCASAWIALRAVLDTPVSGVIALNPQMYWNQGDPVEIDWDQIRARRASEIGGIAKGQRWGLWTMLDLVGHRPRAAVWLDELADTGVPIHLLFAERDDGLQFLSQRLGRRLARVQQSGKITTRELPEVDHPMHLTWLRPRVVQAIHEQLERIDSSR